MECEDCKKLGDLCLVCARHEAKWRRKECKSLRQERENQVLVLEKMVEALIDYSKGQQLHDRSHGFIKKIVSVGNSTTLGFEACKSELLKREALVLAKDPIEAGKRIRAEIEAKAVRPFMHIHVSDTGTDACKECGLDLRHKVHESARQAGEPIGKAG